MRKTRKDPGLRSIDLDDIPSLAISFHQLLSQSQLLQQRGSRPQLPAFARNIWTSNTQQTAIIVHMKFRLVGPPKLEAHIESLDDTAWQQPTQTQCVHSLAVSNVQQLTYLSRLQCRDS